jgi:hypothetical protein
VFPQVAQKAAKGAVWVGFALSSPTQHAEILYSKPMYCICLASWYCYTTSSGKGLKMLNREEAAILAIKSDNKKSWQKYFLKLAKREAQKFIVSKQELGYISSSDVLDKKMINFIKEEMLIQLMQNYRYEFFIILKNKAFKMSQKLATNF